ncbi:hypothetical protein DERF_011426 [Dermatophagoides farinae]|uniref:Uncharacterized protein n=1 Tax=Dermatophagoides farinae TaxID=6954 RepID=A0A922L0F1_DERFA|nr:hypothetical protein DERF_011426 [Dermatophagoides farinae]
MTILTEYNTGKPNQKKTSNEKDVRCLLWIVIIVRQKYSKFKSSNNKDGYELLYSFWQRKKNCNLSPNHEEY